MVDGKVCNALTDTKSAQCSYICKASSKDFNKIDEMLVRPTNESNFKFGPSTLHMWIRCFECCLHISYKLGGQKWQGRKDDHKADIMARRKRIQAEFKERLGLLADKPKPGYGITNDGNAARRFFESAAVCGQITGINEDLINRFHCILQVILSGHEIDMVKFEEYALVTARKYVELYPWYYMATAIHKLLIHGAAIINSSILPIGQMYKNIKRFTEDFSRKSNRVKTMEDFFYVYL